MATKNIVPNADGEGQLGTSSKSWAEGHIDSITGTIATAAQGSITSLGTLTALTVDDITINGSTISDSGDLLFDIGGDISLDAAGGDFIFLVGGSQYGKINFLGTNNLTISGSAANHAGLSFATHAILPAEVSATTDGTVDLGASSEQFKTIFLSTGVVVANDGTIGSAGTTNAITIESNGAATFTSSVIGSRLFSGDGGNTTNPMIANALDQDTGIFFPATNTMAFTAGNTEVFRIASGYLYNGATGITKIGNAGDYEFIDALGSGTRRFRPATDDAIDIGDASHRFDDIFATNGTINTSDKNQKNTITESDLGLDFVKKLLPKSYKFNNKTRTHYGLISQDVEDLLSDISKDTQDFAGFIKSPKDIDDKNNSEFIYGLRYNEFIAPMIKAIQEQQVIIEDLKSRIEVLEG